MPLKRIRNRLNPRYVWIESNHRRSQSVLVFGSARSGSTWLAEVLCGIAHYRQVFEPLHHNIEASSVVRRKGGPKPYLRPDADEPEIRAFFEQVLEGRFRHPATDRFNTYWFPRGRLVKLIRGNLLAGWLRSQFPEVPQVLILRHPCAAAYSACQLGMGIRPESLQNFLKQRDLMEDYLEPYRDRIDRTRDTFLVQVVRWCVESLVPLRQFTNQEIPIVFYETLLEDPESELPPLVRTLGFTWRQSHLGLIRTPSRTSWGDHSGMKAGRSPISNWRDKVEPAQIDQAVRILVEFGLDVLYDDDPMPKPEGLGRFRNARRAVVEPQPRSRP